MTLHHNIESRAEAMGMAFSTIGVQETLRLGPARLPLAVVLLLVGLPSSVLKFNHLIVLTRPFRSDARSQPLPYTRFTMFTFTP